MVEKIREESMRVGRHRGYRLRTRRSLKVGAARWRRILEARRAGVR